jgi:hypothetical protein
VLIVGANDVSAHFGDFLQGDPMPFVQGVVANVETALTTVAAAGDVRLAVGTVPDVTLTPSFQQLISPGSPLQREIAGAVAAADVQIEGFAASQGVPVIDLAGLGRLAEAPLAVGGVPVPNFYAPDGFHPATVPQGLLGNAILGAFAGAYDPRIARFRLTPTSSSWTRPASPTPRATATSTSAPTSSSPTGTAAQDWRAPSALGAAGQRLP